MTVSELINELEKYDKDKGVEIFQWDRDVSLYIDSIEEDRETGNLIIK